MGVKDTANLAMIPAAYAEDKVYSVLPSDGDGDFTFTRSGSGTRINKGGYIETMAENVPRLNYRLDADGNPTECAELLLEASVSNFITRSEEFDLWGDSGVTVTANDTVAPSGAKTADLLTSSANNWRRSQSASVTNGGGYVFSCFVKKHTTTNKIRFELYRGASASFLDFEFGINNLTASDSNLTSLKVQKYPNDWYRVSCKFTANGTTFICYAYPSQGYGTSGSAYFWGAQLEQGADFPTSYIPTSGLFGTRNMDQAIRLSSDVTPTSYPFTVMVQMRIETGKKGYGFSLLNRYANYLYFSVAYCEISANNRFRFSNRNNGTTYSVQPSAEYFEGIHKVAIKFVSETNFKAYINGIEVANLTHTASAFDTNNNAILLGQLRTVTDTNTRNPIKEFFIWHKALTDAEMVDVTSYDTFAEMANDQQFIIQ